METGNDTISHKNTYFGPPEPQKHHIGNGNGKWIGGILKKKEMRVKNVEKYEMDPQYSSCVLLSFLLNIFVVRSLRHYMNHFC